MTTPTLSFGVRGCGRHYPWPPQPVGQLRRNQWGSVDPRWIPDTITPLPSVTNVLSILAKNLTGWAGEHAIRSLYASGQIPLDVEAAVESHKWAANKVRDQRADAGTRAHTIADRLTQGLPLPSDLSDEDEAYADAYLAFWADHDPTPLHVEATVMHPDVGYAGTADLFAEIGGSVVVLDYKTRGAPPDPAKRSKYGVLYDENRMQLAALAHATHIAVEDGGWHTVPSLDVSEGWGVVLYPDGSFDVETLDLSDLERWFDCFQGVLRAWRVLKGIRQEVAA